jgi:hypothetical protein
MQFTRKPNRISGNCKSILPSLMQNLVKKLYEKKTKFPPFQIFVTLKTPFYFTKRHAVIQKHSTGRSNAKSKYIPSSIDRTTGYVL